MMKKNRVKTKNRWQKKNHVIVDVPEKEKCIVVGVINI